MSSSESDMRLGKEGMVKLLDKESSQENQYFIIQCIFFLTLLLCIIVCSALITYT